MLRDVKLNVFYPYSPERVWQVLTNRRALAAWLTENDFEPRVGHQFRFQTHLAGLQGTVHCEVIELDEPRRLSYTWQEPLMRQPSLVTWTLTPVDGGTQVQLQHHGYRQPIELSEPVRSTYQWQSQFLYSTTVPLTLSPFSRSLPSQSNYIKEGLENVMLNFCLNDEWDYRLNQRLPQVLVSLASNNE